MEPNPAKGLSSTQERVEGGMSQARRPALEDSPDMGLCPGNKGEEREETVVVKMPGEV